MSFLVELPEHTYRDRMSSAFSAAAVFDFPTARAMAWLAQLAYEQEPVIRRVLEAWGLAWRAPLVGVGQGLLPLAATRGFVADGWGGTVVAFAGTDPMVLANWLTDFHALPTPEGMHAGFESALRVVWPALQAALAGASPGGRLLFTGHSLGAAIAVLAARRASAVAAVDGVYTFGMPRCGGRAFAEAYEAALGARTYRFVNGHDIVPTVPPSGFGYRHVGRSLLCRHGAAFDAAAPLPAAPTDDPPLAQTVVDGIRSGIRNLWRRDLPPPVQPGRLGKLYTFLPPGIGDHLPARYLHALGALAEDAAT